MAALSDPSSVTARGSFSAALVSALRNLLRNRVSCPRSSATWLPTTDRVRLPAVGRRAHQLEAPRPYGYNARTAATRFLRDFPSHAQALQAQAQSNSEGWSRTLYNRTFT